MPLLCKAPIFILFVHDTNRENAVFARLDNLVYLKNVDPSEYVNDISYERYDIVGISNNAFSGTPKKMKVEARDFSL